MGTRKIWGPPVRVLVILAIGAVLLATGLVWTLSWLAIANPFVQPSPVCCPACYCTARIARLVLPPNPLPLLLAYGIAVPSLMTMGARLAIRGVPASKASRFAGWLLFGTMAAIGSYTLALLTLNLPFVEGTTGTTWLLISIVTFLAVPALVLGSGAVLLTEMLRDRFTRRPRVSV